MTYNLNNRKPNNYFIIIIMDKQIPQSRFYIFVQ